MEAGRRVLWREMRGGLGSGMFTKGRRYGRLRMGKMACCAGMVMAWLGIAREIHDLNEYRRHKDLAFRSSFNFQHRWGFFLPIFP